jgi:hypothetical protein
VKADRRRPRRGNRARKIVRRSARCGHNQEAESRVSIQMALDERTRLADA